MISAKISAIMLVILITIVTTSFFSYLSITYHPEQKEPSPSYIVSDIITVQSLTVWHKNESITAVNQTEITWLNFYRLTYNQTSLEIRKDLIDQWFVNGTTSLIYENTSASYAIQWAVDNGNQIDFEKGSYNITGIIFLDSGTILDGHGSWFIFKELPAFSVNNTNTIASISGCILIIEGEASP